ncbi:MAG: cation transporter [Deltaproteobacteria bacterium]|nr:cation transporter [Deltaproteobacteria bacterium]
MNHNHHHHSHGATKNIKVAFFLNLGFTVLEIIGGFITNSMAILADAAHDLGDSFALGQAWYFERLAGEKANGKYTYGYKRFSLLGAFVSTALLLLSSLYVLSQAIPRIITPEHSDAKGMAILAVIGVAVNSFAMFKLAGQKGLNTRVVALHLLEDVLGWAAVLVVAIVLLFTDIHILDPILAILITLYILGNVVKNLRSLVPLFLQAAPENVDMETIVRDIESIEHVMATHHAHIWSLDGEHNVFTAHLVIDRELSPSVYQEIKDKVRDVTRKYDLYHSTVEIESPGEVCRIPENGCCQYD